MKNYMDIVNAETELLKKKRKLELDYENEMKAIEKRLAEYEEYKNDFKNGNGDWALAKEYVTLYKPFNLLRRFDTFIPKLKDALKENWQLMLEKDLLLLDEANSMTYRVFAKLVDKNKSYNYPKLGEVQFLENTPVEYFEKLYMELDEVNYKYLKNVQGIEYCKNLSKDPFQNLRELNYIWSFKLKTKEYDYTKLVKLLNFPQEFSCYGSKGEEVRYKLNGTSYDFYIWDTDNKVWVNYKELVETE